MPNTANAPFVGLYSLKLRDLISCLTGQELQVFIALTTYVNEAGMCWPGVRELSAVTSLPTTTVSRILESLQQYKLVVSARRNERDEFTGRLKPDIYALSPEIVLVSKPDFWYRHNASIVPSAPYIMPESISREEFTQPDRITEPESGNQKQRSRITGSFEGAATLNNANTQAAPAGQTNALGNPISRYAGTNSTAASANAPNSHAQRNAPSPGSGAPPPRDLTFSEGVVANAIRREISDMSAETVRSLIARYGVDQVNAAVLSFKKRNEKRPIGRPTGWIIRNLESGAK